MFINNIVNISYFSLEGKKKLLLEENLNNIGSILNIFSISKIILNKTEKY